VWDSDSFVVYILLTLFFDGDEYDMKGAVMLVMFCQAVCCWIGDLMNLENK